jgi:hypothetical protein
LRLRSVPQAVLMWTLLEWPYASLDHNKTKREASRMSTGLILIIILVVLLLGSAPSWPYSRGWGYRPSGLFGLILLIVLILVLLGRI